MERAVTRSDLILFEQRWGCDASTFPRRFIPAPPSTNAWLGRFDVRPVDLAAAYAVLLASHLAVAGKTGTSDGVYDAWFVGYGSDVTIAVWIGFPEGNRTILKGETGGSLAFPVWKKLIEGLPAEYAFAPLAELPLMTASQ